MTTPYICFEPTVLQGLCRLSSLPHLPPQKTAQGWCRHPSRYLSQFSGSFFIFYSRIQFTRSPRKLAQYCGRFTFTFSFFPQRSDLCRSINPQECNFPFLLAFTCFLFVCFCEFFMFPGCLLFIWSQETEKPKTNK